MFTKDCIPCEGLHDGAGEETEEKGAVEMKRYELTATTELHCREEAGMSGMKD